MTSIWWWSCDIAAAIRCLPRKLIGGEDAAAPLFPPPPSPPPRPLGGEEGGGDGGDDDDEGNDGWESIIPASLHDSISHHMGK